jgi:hypothetical protein
MSSVPRKVYCGDCQHYSFGFSDRDYENCAVEPMRYVSTHVSPRVLAYPLGPATKNAKNDCKDWKPRTRKAGR